MEELFCFCEDAITLPKITKLWQDSEVLHTLTQSNFSQNFIKQLKVFKLELIAFAAVISILGLTQTASFNGLLVSQANTSPAFKFLAAHSSLNVPLLNLAANTSGNQTQSSLLAVASAYDGSSVNEINATGLDESGGQVLATSTFSETPEYSAIVKPSYSVTSIPTQENSGGVGVYKVAEGDTPVAIASRFNVSLATLLIENNLNEKSVIKPGQELRVLTIDGITHEVKAGDTLDGLAKKYGVDGNSILDANDLETDEDLLHIGTTIIIPKDNLQIPKAQVRLVNNSSGRVAATTASAPSNFVGAAGDMIWPTSSRVITQYFSRRHNGLDISGMRQNPGPSLFAVKDGYVTYAGWQSGGWGNTVLINIGGGYIVRYAHLSVIDVQAGDKVSQGDIIGRIGNTGRSTGPHLHFTIYKNGVAQNPLYYVKP